MFDWYYKKIVNPNGLDASLLWLNSLSNEKEREDSANQICILCISALTRNKYENIEFHYFIKLYKNASDEALNRFHKKEISLTDPACKYIAFAFVVLYSYYDDHPDAEINISKILKFLEKNAQPAVYARLFP